jgi:hypothetical protein
MEGIIATFGIGCLPQTVKFLRTSKAFDTEFPEELATWFGRESGLPTDDLKNKVVGVAERLRRAAKPPVHWSKRDSGDLGWLIYQFRSVIIHPRMQTYQPLASRVLPALRDALLELGIARAAILGETSLEKARHRVISVDVS